MIVDYARPSSDLAYWAKVEEAADLGEPLTLPGDERDLADYIARTRLDDIRARHGIYGSAKRLAELSPLDRSN